MARIETLHDLEAYCRRHENSIFVKTQINGRRDVYAFADLPPEQQDHWLRAWFANGEVPKIGLATAS